VDTELFVQPSKKRYVHYEHFKCMLKPTRKQISHTKNENPAGTD